MSELISDANTELEVSLLNDSSGDFKRSLIEKLNAENNMINRHLAKGLVPEQYKKYSSLSEAINYSIKVIENMWVRFHGE
ncbi:MAG: EscE/YscE/SsaE family type III secretion system needle protein co-chaperone [Gammaproteobacteria bacterium]